jgi:hypothetical protein
VLCLYRLIRYASVFESEDCAFCAVPVLQSFHRPIYSLHVTGGMIRMIVTGMHLLGDNAHEGVENLRMTIKVARAFLMIVVTYFYARLSLGSGITRLV